MQRFASTNGLRSINRPLAPELKCKVPTNIVKYITVSCQNVSWAVAFGIFTVMSLCFSFLNLYLYLCVVP